MKTRQLLHVTKYSKYELIVPFCSFCQQKVIQLLKSAELLHLKDAACAIRRELIWSTSTISTYNELDKNSYISLHVHQEAGLQDAAVCCSACERGYWSW